MKCTRVLPPPIMHMGGPATHHGNGPPPHQLVVPHRISSGLSGQLVPAPSVGSSSAPGRSSPRAGTTSSSSQAAQHAESSTSAPPPNAEAATSYQQPISVTDHSSKSQGVAVSAADAALAGGVRLHVAQTPQGHQACIPTGYAMIQYPGGQLYAVSGSASHRPIAGALHEASHSLPEGDNTRYSGPDGMTYISSATAVTSGLGPQAVSAHKATPPGGARGVAHDQQQHSQHIQVGANTGNAGPGQQIENVPIERAGSGSHAWPVAIPVHSGALGTIPVALQGSGEPLSTYASAAEAAIERGTPCHSQREESQATSEGHVDMSGKPRTRTLSGGGHAASEDSLTACTPRNRSNPQLQGQLPPRRSAGHHRASSETRQCVTEFSGASSATSLDEAPPPPRRVSKTNSVGTAPAAGHDSGPDASVPVSSALDHGTAVHVLSPQGSYHNISHLHPDIQVLRPYLPQQYVELRSSGGTGAHHANLHSGGPPSQGPQNPPGAIYLSPSPGTEGLHAGVMRAGMPGGTPVVVSTGGMPAGHHIHMPLGAPGQGPATLFIHAHPHAHPHQPPHNQPGGGGPGSNMAPQAHVLPGHAIHGVPLHVHLQPHQQLAHGIEGAHQGMYSIVQLSQPGIYLVCACFSSFVATE
jgi:uncharacterized RmlC-like cupin family protein